MPRHDIIALKEFFVNVISVTFDSFRKHSIVSYKQSLMFKKHLEKLVPNRGYLGDSLGIQYSNFSY